jgi:hypothetical protein
MKFLLASMKTLTNSKNCSKSRIKFLFQLSFALIGHLFPVYIHSQLSEQFSGSQAGYGTTFRDTGRYQKAGTSCMKRVTGRNFTISKREARGNFHSFKKYCFHFKTFREPGNDQPIHQYGSTV